MLHFEEKLLSIKISRDSLYSFIRKTLKLVLLYNVIDYVMINNNTL